MRAVDRLIQDRLVARATELLGAGEVDLVLGHRRRGLPLGSRPAFVSDPAQAKELVFDEHCGLNLTVYLPRLLRPSGRKAAPRVAIVVKGCDARSLVGLVKERQIPRDNLIVLGVPCLGVVDLHRLQRLVGGAEIVDTMPDDSGSRVVLTDHLGRSHQLELDALLRDGCRTCRHPTPVMCDELLGEPLEPRAAEARFAALEAIEALPSAARWQRFRAEIAKCIRCYACRQACPSCYCTTCFAEQTSPAWTTPAAQESDVMLFHLGRLLHMAGRCTECGACTAACPTGVDLSPYAAMIIREVEDQWGKEANVSLDDLPAMIEFNPEDDQSFMTEPQA